MISTFAVNELTLIVRSGIKRLKERLQLVLVFIAKALAQLLIFLMLKVDFERAHRGRGGRKRRARRRVDNRDGRIAFLVQIAYYGLIAVAKRAVANLEQVAQRTQIVIRVQVEVELISEPREVGPLVGVHVPAFKHDIVNFRVAVRRLLEPIATAQVF